MSTKNLNFRTKIQLSSRKIPQGQQQISFPKYWNIVNPLIQLPGINVIKVSKLKDSQTLEIKLSYYKFTTTCTNLQIECDRNNEKTSCH
jgi:hypothetical protein